MKPFEYKLPINKYFLSLLQKEESLFNLINDYFENTTVDNYKEQHKKIKKYNEYDIKIDYGFEYIKSNETGKITTMDSYLVLEGKTFNLKLQRQYFEGEWSLVQYNYQKRAVDHYLLIANHLLGYKKLIKDKSLLKATQSLSDKPNKITIELRDKPEKYEQKVQISPENYNYKSLPYTIDLTKKLNSGDFNMLSIMCGSLEEYKKSIDISEINMLNNDDDSLLTFLKEETLFNILKNDKIPLTENKSLIKKISNAIRNKI